MSDLMRGAYTAARMDFNWNFKFRFKPKVLSSSTPKEKLTAFITALSEYDYAQRYPHEYKQPSLKMDTVYQGYWKKKYRSRNIDFVQKNLLVEYKFTINSNFDTEEYYKHLEEYSFDGIKTELVFLNPRSEVLRGYWSSNKDFKIGFAKSLFHLKQLKAFTKVKTEKLLPVKNLTLEEIDLLIPDPSVRVSDHKFTNMPEREILDDTKYFLKELMPKLLDWQLKPTEMSEFINEGKDNLLKDEELKNKDQISDPERLWDRDETANHKRFPNLFFVPRQERYEITRRDLLEAKKSMDSKLVEILDLVLLMQEYPDEIRELSKVTKELAEISEDKSKQKISKRRRKKKLVDSVQKSRWLRNVERIEILDGKVMFKPGKALKDYYSPSLQNKEKQKDPDEDEENRASLFADIFKGNEFFREGLGLMDVDPIVTEAPKTGNPALKVLYNKLHETGVDVLNKALTHRAVPQLYSDFLALSSVLMATITDNYAIREKTLFPVQTPLPNFHCFTTSPPNDTNSGAIIRMIKAESGSEIERWYGDYFEAKLDNNMSIYIFKPIRLSMKWLENIEENFGSFIGTLTTLAAYEIEDEDDLLASLFALPAEMLLGAADLTYLFYRQLIATGNFGRYKAVDKMKLAYPTEARTATILYRLKRDYTAFYKNVFLAISEIGEVKNLIDPIFRINHPTNQSVSMTTYFKNAFGKEHSHTEFARFKKYFKSELDQEFETRNNNFKSSNFDNGVIKSPDIKEFTAAAMNDKGFNKCVYWSKGINFATNLMCMDLESKDLTRESIDKVFNEFPADGGVSSRCFVPSSHFPERKKKTEEKKEGTGEFKKPIKKEEALHQLGIFVDDIDKKIKTKRKEKVKREKPKEVMINKDGSIEEKKGLYPGIRSVPLSVAINLETNYLQKYVQSDKIREYKGIDHFTDRLQNRELTYGELVVLIRMIYPDFAITTQVVKAQKDKEQRAFQMQVFNSVIFIKLIDQMFMSPLSESDYDILLKPGLDKYLSFQVQMNMVQTSMTNFKLTIDMEKYGDMYPIEAIEVMLFTMKGREAISEVAFKTVMYVLNCLRDRLMLMHPSLQQKIEAVNSEFVLKKKQHGLTQTIIQSTLASLLDLHQAKYTDLLDLTETVMKCYSFNKSIGFVLGSLNRIGSLLSSFIPKMTNWCLTQWGLSGCIHGSTHSDDQMLFTNFEVKGELRITENLRKFLDAKEAKFVKHGTSAKGQTWKDFTNGLKMNATEAFFLTTGLMMFWSKVVGQSPSLLKWFYGVAGEVLQVQIIGRVIEVPLYRYCTVLLADLPGLCPGDDLMSAVGRVYDLIANNAPVILTMGILYAMNWLVNRMWGIKELNFNKPIYFGGSYFASPSDIVEFGFEANEVRLRSVILPEKLCNYSKVAPHWKSHEEIDGVEVSTYKQFHIKYLTNKKTTSLFNDIWEANKEDLTTEMKRLNIDKDLERSKIVRELRLNWLIKSIAGDKSKINKTIDLLQTTLSDESKAELFKRRKGLKLINKRGYLNRKFNNPFVGEEGMITIHEIWEITHALEPVTKIPNSYKLTMNLFRTGINSYISKDFTFSFQKKTEKFSAPYRKLKAVQAIGVEIPISRELLGIVAELLGGKSLDTSLILRNKPSLQSKAGFIDAITTVVGVMKVSKITERTLTTYFNFFLRALKGSEIRSTVACEDAGNIFKSMLLNYDTNTLLVIEDLNISSFGKRSSKEVKLDVYTRSRAQLLRFWYTRLAGSFRSRITSQAEEGKEVRINLPELHEVVSSEIDKNFAAGKLAEIVDDFQKGSQFEKYPMLLAKTRYLKSSRKMAKEKEKELVFTAVEYRVNPAQTVAFTYVNDKYRVYSEGFSILTALNYAKMLSFWMNSRRPINEFKNIAIDNDEGELQLGAVPYVTRPGASGMNTYAVSSFVPELKNMVSLSKTQNGWNYEHTYEHVKGDKKEWREVNYTIVPWLETTKRTFLNFTTEFASIELEERESKEFKYKKENSPESFVSVTFSDSFRRELIPVTNGIYIPGFDDGEYYNGETYKFFEISHFKPILSLFDNILMKANGVTVHYPLGNLEKLILMETLSCCRIDELQNYWIGRKLKFKYYGHYQKLIENKTDSKFQGIHINSLLELVDTKNLRYILPIMGHLAILEGKNESVYYRRYEHLINHFTIDENTKLPFLEKEIEDRDYFDDFKENSFDLGEFIPTNAFTEILKSIGSSSHFNKIDWNNRGFTYNKNTMNRLLFDNLLLSDKGRFSTVDLQNLSLT
jgi:hypothetical protein